MIVLGVCAARLWSCVGPAITGHTKAQPFEIVPVSDNEPRHKKIVSALEREWKVSDSESGDVQLLIAKSDEINAASFGNGRFLFWEGTANLSQDDLEAIAAHEVAHDVLKHSRNASELQDLTDFFGEALSFISGSDDETEKTLKHWFGNAVLPKYNRAQELAADSRAVELLRLSGYQHPSKVMSHCLETLLSKYGSSGGRFFDTHPSTQERIQKLRSETSTDQ